MSYMCFSSYYYPHSTVIILRNPIINNDLRGLYFHFQMIRTSTTFVLGCSSNYCSRVSSLIISHGYIPFFLQHMSAVTTAVLPSCPFHQLRHPRDFTSHTSRRGTLCKYVHGYGLLKKTTSRYSEY